MGFLSGVLEAVKNENEVITYDKKDGNDINKLISDLNKNIGSGRKGLAASVDAVKGWLEGYEGNYRSTTNAFTAFFLKFHNAIENLKMKIPVLGERFNVDLQSFTGAFDELRRTAYNGADSTYEKLDETLKCKLECSVKLVKQAVTKFEDLSKNDDHQTIYQLVTQKFTLLKALKDKKVGHKQMITEVVNDVKSQVKTEIDGIITFVDSLHEELKTFISAADLFVKEAQEKVAAIVKMLNNGSDEKERGKVEDAVRMLQDNAEEILVAAQIAKNEVTRLVKEAHTAVITMNDALKTDLAVMKDEIGRKLQDFKNGFEAITKLEENVQTGLLALRSEIVDGVKKHVKDNIIKKIKEDVDSIKGQNKDQGLHGFVTYVTEQYVKKFKESEGFEGIVKGWIQTILGSQPVTEDIKEYIAYDRSSFNESKLENKKNEFNSETIAEIASVITDNLKVGVIQKATEKFTQALGKGGINGNTNAVQTVFRTFADELSSKIKTTDDIKSTDSSKFVWKMVTEIEKKVEHSIKKGHTNKYILRSVVLSTLSALYSSAKQIGEQLKSFTGYDDDSDASKIANVDEGFRTVEKLYANLHKASGEVTQLAISDPVSLQTSDLAKHIQDIEEKVKSHIPGDSGETTLHTTETFMQDFKKTNATLKSAIKNDTLDNALKTQLPGYGKIALNRASTFTNYKTHVSQTGAKTGALEKAIQKIKIEVDEQLSNLPNRVTFNAIMEDAEKKFAFFCKEISKLADKNAVQSPGVDDGLKQKLTQINELIGKDDTTLIQIEHRSVYGLQKIVEYVRNLHDTILIQLKKSVDSAFECAKTEAHDIIDEIHSKYQVQIENAFYRIESTTKALYTRTKMSELNGLQKIVETQHQAMITAIAFDYNNGVKGLMKRMKAEEHDLTHIMSLVAVQMKQHTSAKGDAQKFRDASDRYQTYVDRHLHYVSDQINVTTRRTSNQQSNSLPTPPTNSPPTDPASKLTKIKEDFDNLLEHLKNENQRKTYNYDHAFTEKLASLKDATNDLSPSTFANPRHPELLDAVRAGLQGFVKEMGRVYVNGYEGGFENVLLVYANTGNVTEEGKKCAKIFLTVLSLLRSKLYDLYMKCSPTFRGEWQNMNICLYDVDKKIKENGNPLGHWFQRRGYKVPKDKNTQDGELRNSVSLKGNEIIALCNNVISNVDPATITMLGKYANSKDKSVKLVNLLIVLHDSKLSDFYKVCHLNMRPNPKPPTTICQMLQWLPGLWFNPMFSKVTGYFTTLLTSLKDEYKLQADALDVAVTSNLKSEINTAINHKQLADTLRNVCLYSRDTLIAIVGHGHSDGRYACEYFMNVENLLYPSSPSACFDMLADIICRLYTQLCFLYKQCYNGRSRGGWEDCWYGKGIAGSAWHCNDYQCPNQECERKDRQTDDQNADQSGNQKCNQHSKCGIKSPLQSFLEDGLQGFLPHRLEKVGCGVKCSLSNHHGKPCLTPMGLADIGITASHTKTGAHLKEALRNFCGPISHLTKLCSIITCLIRRPPQTLGDMFAFYYHFINGWYETGKGERENHREIAFNLAVKAANFKIPETKLEIKSMFSSSSHATHAPGKLPKHNGDLLSLVACDSKTLPGLPCGRYLQPISNDIMVVYSKYHASHYLSWVVYITETFYDLLKKLYDECCQNCNRPGKRCYDKSCVKDCQVRFSYGYKKPTEDANPAGFENIKHEDSCGSIVKCRATHAAMYSAGFTFGSPFEMSGDDGRRKKRTCEDFCQALGFVVRPGNALYMLVNKTIPDFLWQIREKFFWTTVALWSLSLFYLMCVMVGRLDVLHIRSHLRIPSSHKITAQSLLAAAQVGRLAKISYLQP
ncbi:hypothetical protein, conserved [Babesia bigemina]|uniref:C3H1-type domain-containing protein n=1 Tax=Babesia bigemina TaxID=5866 RepID=A0A061BPP5_BABBI|nr:hypothetical protein, conserved [Babesia bigemina]CDR71471.1 hypothetical protein, conserved [Babesia bigemina]|eukprot:XP_012770418.1 hypothetical protein, conserved [Babesia bigemina]